MIGAIGLLVCVALAQPHDYSIGSWEEAGKGNHRVVVRVTEPADAVLARVQWRRRDHRPEEKAVLVFDAATGERVRNAFARTVTRELGEIAFEPTSGAGEYHIYFLPYDPPGTGPFGEAGPYYPPEDTADAEWTAGLTADLPRAEVVAIEARAEFHRMDPMEVIATRAEADALLAAHPDEPYLLFPEDREHPIRMFEDVPHRWIESGPSDHFVGEARPNEFYVFQVGVYAANADVRGMRVKLHSLAGPRGGAIEVGRQTCLNARPPRRSLRPWPLMDLVQPGPGPTVAYTQTVPGKLTAGHGIPGPSGFSVSQGRVRPLWIGVDVPYNAEGSYRGSIELRSEGLKPRRLRLTIDVGGEPLADKGDSDLWRLSRLRWLNSDLGFEREVVPPFTPVEKDGDTVRILGREITYNESCLPERITSNGRDILAGPVSLTVGGEPIAVKAPADEDLVDAAGTRVAHDFSPADRSLVGRLSVWTEFDGCISYKIALRASRDTDAADVRLEVPVKRDVARYFMGFGKRGGYRPDSWEWKWDVERANNMGWLGDWDAGLQLKLLGETNSWQMRNLKDTGLPDWANGGLGGVEMVEEGDAVVLRADTGRRSLKKGEIVYLNFRLLVTPFKPIDPRHWSWRYGAPEAGGTVAHVHHATGVNPYINYPFLTTDALKEMVDAAKAPRMRKLDEGELAYPAAGNINPQQGALHVWARVNFDPSAGAAKQAAFNQPLLNLDFPNDDSLGFYWNVDDRGMRAYVRHGAPRNNAYPILFGTHQPEWRQGEPHLLTVTWGERLAVYIDGQLAGQGAYTGTSPAPLGDSVMLFRGGFGLGAIKLTDQPHVDGMPIEPVVDEHTLLLDTFDSWDGGERTSPERGDAGIVTGVCEKRGFELVFSAREEPAPERGVNVYYTIRELTNRLPELWALRSMGDEIYTTAGESIYGDFDVASHTPVGYAWLREHLVAGYEPAWRSRLSDDEIDTAIAQQPVSRWHNYYVEGMRRLMADTGIDGLYLDGIGYDRETMKRVARVMHEADPDSRINFHSGDGWSPPWDPGRLISPANQYMEHFPYISNLWFGELFDYDMPPDYWLVEISGIPFGLTGEMLNYQTGGNAYRGMVYGMDGRQNPSCQYLWRLWDEFGIAEAEWLGYWRPDCPVRTDRSDVPATVYRKPGKSLIALAHWPTEERLPEVAVMGGSAPPSIDGALAEGEWDGAARLTNFTEFGSVDLAVEQTDVYLAHDDERLYIGFRCEHAAPGIKAESAGRDGEVYMDDAVEIFVQPSRDDARYLQFVGNSVGAFRDAEGLDADWDAEWEYAASRGEGCWVGELSVAFAELGMAPPGPNTPMGLNICRDRQTPSALASVWSPVRDTFHDPKRFGRVTLAADHAATRESRRAPGEQVESTPVRLRVDWGALGIDPETATIAAPDIQYFQPAARYGPDEAIEIPASKGCLLVVE